MYRAMLRDSVRLGYYGVEVQLGHNRYNIHAYFAQPGSPEAVSSHLNIDLDNILSLQLPTDKDFRKHRNRLAYLSLYYG